MAVDAQYIINYFPALGLSTPTDDDMINRYLVWATTLTDEAIWLTKYDLGVANLTAHFIQMNKSGGSGGGASGPITQEKVGDLSRSYGQVTSGSQISDIGETAYGRQYQWLISSLTTSPIFY